MGDKPFKQMAPGSGPPRGLSHIDMPDPTDCRIIGIGIAVEAACRDHLTMAVDGQIAFPRSVEPVFATHPFTP